jgi:hypothetical protein
VPWLVDREGVVAGVGMARRLRHVGVVRIVEDVESGRDWVTGVPTDCADVLRFNGVGIGFVCSVDRFAHGNPSLIIRKFILTHVI